MVELVTILILKQKKKKKWCYHKNLMLEISQHFERTHRCFAKYKIFDDVSPFLKAERRISKNETDG